MTERGAEPAEREVHLSDYVRILRRRRWVALTVFVVIVATVVVGTFLQTPIYRATAKVLIDPEAPKGLNIQDLISGDGRTDYHPTQYELIKSRAVLERVIETGNLKQRMPELAVSKAPAENLLARLTIEPKRNTRLVEVHVDHADAKLAADIANAIAQSYARFNLDMKLKASREVIVWLSEQLNELKAQVQDSASALQKYRVSQGILGAQEQRQITAQKIMDFNRAYLEAQAQRLTSDAKLRELTQVAREKAGAQTMFTVADSLLIQKLKVDLATLETERSKLVKTYKDKHPEVLKVDAQIQQVRDRIDGELQGLVRALETEQKVARAREQTLLGNVQALQREAQSINEKEIQHLALSRESESSQTLYELVLKRLKETGVASGIETNNVRVVEDARVPAKPYRPRKALNVALALTVGLFAGVGVAFFVDYLDRTIKTPEDVERHLGVPVLGVVPAFADRR